MANNEKHPKHNKQHSKIISSNVWVFYSLLVLYSALTVPTNPRLATGQFFLTFLVWAYFQHENKQRQKALVAYLEEVTSGLETPAQENMEQSPLPVMVYRPETGTILWTNQLFQETMEVVNKIENCSLASIVPEYDGRWLIEGKSQSGIEQVVGERRYFVYGSLVRSRERNQGGYLATTYWVDVTDFYNLREKFARTRPTVAVVMLDNYEDLMRNLTEAQSSSMLSAINRKLSVWVEGSGGVFKRYSRESYLLIVEKQYIDKFIEQKFEIIDGIHEIVNPVGINATLSIGVGMDGESLEELMKFANLSIDMALSRGGDQVVIRNKFTFEFYGGRATETEKRTKVKSRVMANALSSLIADSSRVFIMGHKIPDMDAVGACAGVFALARKKNTPAYIIRQGKDSSAEVLYEKLSKLPEYHEKFLTAQESLVMADSRSLVVVVDTNRPDQVQAIEVLQSCNRVAVIDHHRRASEYIEGAVLNYHELYASSACELVTELLQYNIEPTDLLREESEALLAGIVLDTKNFTLRTGGRTFEAAAFLRRCGADTNEVKKLFQNDLEGAVARYKIVQSAQLYRDDIAMAWSPVEVGRVVAAQAADELLNIRGIGTSFVLFPKENQVIISARSMGDVNVQLILEKLGGGGNAAAAGAQVVCKSLEEGLAKLREALDDYLKDEKKQK